MAALIAREVGWLTRRKSFRVTFWGMLLWVLLNFGQTLLKYWGTDVSVLPEPMEFRLASSNNFIWKPLLMDLYPFLVVLPAGFAFLNDEATGTAVYLKARLGQGRYYFMRSLSVFCATFLAFFIPFIIEIFLFIVAYPGGKLGNVSNISPYLEGERFGRMLFPGVFYLSDVAYAVLGAGIFSLTAALLASFAATISAWGMKLKILLFLPAYLLLQGLFYLSQAFVIPFTTAYYFYLTYYDASQKSDAAFLTTQATLALATGLIILLRSKTDDQRIMSMR